MTVLGIDPGLERVGYGVVRREGSRIVAVDFGLVRTVPGPVPSRLAVIFEAVEKLLEGHAVSLMACERLFFGKNQTTGIDVAKAAGVIQLAAAHRGLEVVELSPAEVKLAVVGQGAADKRQVQYMVTRLLGLPEAPRPDDVADALAVGIAAALKGSKPR
ncbi:MAG: crossover junction endodeoxyribonuclease RuvC [Fimbriimonadaceae bacterium]|nr:crossover junction endodeoxyribonuclease RuvC [Fimbriimonadaceae bacterium]QYK57584.1 MAG: crossover junction endodeoxyribonuclease RuvC [Fimbriimonadaceae bacterium]